MYAIIKANEIIYTSDEIPTKQTYKKNWDVLLWWIDYDQVIEYNFIWNPILIDWKIVKNKQEDINKFRLIEKEAKEKRNEYLTAELLPDWVFKTMKIEKLEEERIDIEARYSECMNSLVSEYWESILSELI